MFRQIAQRLACIAILSLLSLNLEVFAQGYSDSLSSLENLAFGHSQENVSFEERLSSLEQKAYGKTHTGALPMRLAALQFFFGVPGATPPTMQNYRLQRPKDNELPIPQPASGVSPVQGLPFENIDQSDSQLSNQRTKVVKPRAPLQAGVSQVQMHMNAGDDERFGGLWIGTLASKIDPHVKVLCELHGSGRNFTGTMIWTSAICGGCRRTIVGYFDSKDQACTMKDLNVEPLDPRNPAGFCRVDRYAFGVTENVERLAGWFKSSQCKDEGAVNLVRYREP